MASNLEALGSSVEYLRSVVEGLSDAQFDEPAYPTEWTIADVLSHIGSGAVIMQRRLDDIIDENATPDDFAPGVWDTWNAKAARAKAADALVADRDLLLRIESLPDEARSNFRFSMGPLELSFDGFVGMRLNEHALHTWDVEVAIDPAATVPAESAAHIVDNLELIARYTARPTGNTRAIAVRTGQPGRDFSIGLSPDAVTLGAEIHRPSPISNFRPRKPAGARVVQQACNLTTSLAGRGLPVRYLVRDRDAKFTSSFDEVFRCEGIRIIRTPIRAPRANAIAERFVGTIRRECLDRLLIFHRCKLEAVLAEYIEHYNQHRPHRSLEQASPLSDHPSAASSPNVM